MEEVLEQNKESKSLVVYPSHYEARNCVQVELTLPYSDWVDVNCSNTGDELSALKFNE